MIYQFTDSKGEVHKVEASLDSYKTNPVYEGIFEYPDYEIELSIRNPPPNIPAEEFEMELWEFCAGMLLDEYFAGIHWDSSKKVPVETD